jgi:double-stranded uracil-DNA glycosylase
VKQTVAVSAIGSAGRYGEMTLGEKDTIVERSASWMGETYAFQTLPDYLQPGLDLVFVGINPGLYSVQQGHYFARSTSRFWPAFSASRLSERARQALGIDSLRAEYDGELPRFGIGFTDVVKRPSANAAELTASDFEKWAPCLLEKLQHYKPHAACFHGLTGYRPFLNFALRSAGRRPTLGHQPEVIGATRLYVVPNPSPANAHFTLADQTAWYDRLAEFLAAAGPATDC